MKSANSNPMGLSSGSGKPDAGVLRRMKAKVSSNMNNGNQVLNKPNFNPPSAKSKATNPMGVGQPPRTPKAKLNRKPRTR